MKYDANSGSFKGSLCNADTRIANSKSKTLNSFGRIFARISFGCCLHPKNLKIAIASRLRVAAFNCKNEVVQSEDTDVQ